MVEPIPSLHLGLRSPCYIGAGGERWCAGENNDGQLGLGDTNADPIVTDRLVPGHEVAQTAEKVGAHLARVVRELLTDGDVEGGQARGTGHRISGVCVADRGETVIPGCMGPRIRDPLADEHGGERRVAAGAVGQAPGEAGEGLRATQQTRIDEVDQAPQVAEGDVALLPDGWHLADRKSDRRCRLAGGQVAVVAEPTGDPVCERGGLALSLIPISEPTRPY